MSALWELAPPVFLGTLLAIIAVMLLAGKHRKLMRGPRRWAAWMYGGGCSGRRGCSCAGCSGMGWKKGGMGWKKGGMGMGWKKGGMGGCPMMMANPQLAMATMAMQQQQAQQTQQAKQ